MSNLYTVCVSRFESIYGLGLYRSIIYTFKFMKYICPSLDFKFQIYKRTFYSYP